MYYTHHQGHKLHLSAAWLEPRSRTWKTTPRYNKEAVVVLVKYVRTTTGANSLVQIPRTKDKEKITQQTNRLSTAALAQDIMQV